MLETTHSRYQGKPLQTVQNFISWVCPVSGICLSFNGWTLKKRGPVFVSIVFFTPYHKHFIAYIGAMFLMFTGPKGKKEYQMEIA
ncbi:hypothetical protein VNO80_09796 [Phaseolus coccineus]|uniref:Uncharacterized protein n=1 Tax=Phaseolus coccineus TaxID=3886 RepID=A0AAN9ND81_PHACN